MSSSKKTAPLVRKVQPPLLKRPRRKFTEEFNKANTDAGSS